MKQDTEASVHMFDATHENPELIWNQSTRTQLRESLERFMLEYCLKSYEQIMHRVLHKTSC